MDMLKKLAGAAPMLLFAGCTTSYYIPNTQNVPVIDGKGVTAITLAGNSDQVEFQAAYGLTDGLAVQANGAWYLPRDEDNGNGGSGRLLEVGPGWYRNLSDRWLFDTYGLVGFGQVENHFPSTLPTAPPTTGRIEAKLMRYALQPGITYKSKYFTATGSVRAGYLTYHAIDGTLLLEGVRQEQYLARNDAHLLVEPALTLRGGTERIRLQLQVMQSLNLTEQDFKQENTLVTLGIALRFAP